MNTPKQEVDLLHHQWLQNPVTKQTLKLLEDQHKRVVGFISNEASNVANTSDATIRQFAVQLKTIETIKKLIYDTPTFVAKSSE